MSERLVLELHVQPGAKRSEFAGMHGERMKVRLAAPPVDGKANAELVSFLAGHYGVAKSDVTIDAGRASRRKRVTVYLRKRASSG